MLASAWCTSTSCSPTTSPFLKTSFSGATGAKGIIDDTQARPRIDDIMSAISTDLDLDMPSAARRRRRQRVEIVKVLFRGARILILDEPTAVLVPEEVDELFVTLNSLVLRATVIFISHKLDEVLQVSNDITVMRQNTVAETTPGNIDRSGLAELMVGSELPSPAGRTSDIKNDVRLNVETSSWAPKGACGDSVSITIRSGEIVGIAGVEGNGQYELCAALLGLMPSTGTVTVDDADLTKATTRQRHMRALPISV